jgi:hypothetical protein
MFWPSCALFPFLAVLSQQFSLAVLSLLFCSTALVPRSPVPSVRSLKLCPGLPYSLSCPGNLSGRPVQSDLPRLPFQCNSKCHVSDVMLQIYCHVLPQLPHLSCSVPAALPLCHVLAILSSVSCPAFTIPIVFSGCPVLSFLSRFFCPVQSQYLV